MIDDGCDPGLDPGLEASRAEISVMRLMTPMTPGEGTEIAGPGFVLLLRMMTMMTMMRTMMIKAADWCGADWCGAPDDWEDWRCERDW
jgi:hypothetical protein